MYPLINKKRKVVFWTSFGSGSSLAKSILLEDFANFDYSKKEISLDEAKEYKNILLVKNPYERFICGIFKEYIDGKKTSTYKPKNIKETFSKTNELVFLEKQTKDLIDISFNKVYDVHKIEYNYLSSILGFSIRSRYQDFFSREVVKYADMISYRQLVLLKNQKNVPSYQSFYENKESYMKIYELYKEDFELCRKYGITYLVDL